MKLFIFTALIVLFLVHKTRARCSFLGKCCTEKENDCRTESYTGGVCYCDEFCTKSGDCCSDYESYCRKQDCVMTYWSHWTSCTARCGRGTRERRRKVHIPPSGGGKTCGPRKQVAYCFDDDPSCNNQETAMLLPTYYKAARKQNDKTTSYCVKYKVRQVTRGCKYATPWYLLNKNDEVCVECASPAMKDNRCTGSQVGLEGTWMAVRNTKCFGTWKSISDVLVDCECGYNHGHDFIFV